MLDQLNDVITGQMAEWNIPGMSIAILSKGNVEAAAFGTANCETGTPVTPDTLFQIGSISKIFTTTLAMTFVDEGKIDLDDLVASYLPDLPLADAGARQTLTVRHLLTHMGGFYGDRFDDHGNGDDALARKVAALIDLRQQTQPGELWTYCNAGFDLVARIIELIGGDTFEKQMRTRVFEPIGLETTTYFASEAILQAVAVGHEEIPGSKNCKLRVARPWPIPRASNGAGGVTSTTTQLLRFAQMHMNDGEIDGNRVLSVASAQAMRSRQTDAGPGATWGIGWARHNPGGSEIVAHGGATNGFTARLTVYPAEQFAMAILTNHNRGSSAYPAIEMAALDRFFGLRDTEAAVIKLPVEHLRTMAGTYKHDLATVTLTADDDGFAATQLRHNPFDDAVTDGLPYRLRPISDSVFRAEGGGNDGTMADFIRNDNGSIRFFRMGGRLGYPQ